MNKKKIIFLTGTRADFGKLKPLISKVDKSSDFDCFVFVTGMHTLSLYGSTYKEVLKQGFENVYIYINQSKETTPDLVFANTIIGFSNYVKELNPDLIVVHGDRAEALAGTVVGAFSNILVAHIEGGEVSGTIDGSIRHAITKLSHIHFVANKESKKRLIQIGEEEENIFVIGSPDIDIMKEENLPSLDEVKKHYGINFDNYSIFLHHPVTTELKFLNENINSIVKSLIKSEKNYIVLYPNNDPGSEIILNKIEQLRNHKNFKVFPSLRFGYFLTLLKHCDFIIGNSSAGIREAEVFGIPCINIGTRQLNRSTNKDIIHINHDEKNILNAINKAYTLNLSPVSYFGNRNSSEMFLKTISNPDLYKFSKQKIFNDLDLIEWIKKFH